MAKGDAMGWFVGGCAVRRGVTGLLTLGLLGTLAGSSGASSPPGVPTGPAPTFERTTAVTLSVDEPVHWSQQVVADEGDAGSGSPASTQGAGVQPEVDRCGQAYRCYRYVLHLPEKRRTGERLRVAVDYREDYINYDAEPPAYEVVLRASNGTELARSRRGWARHEAESALPDPARGQVPVDEGVSEGHLEAHLDDPVQRSVEAVVIADQVREPGMGFEARALLEGPPAPARCGDRCPLLLPDLEPEPPYDLVTGWRGCVVTGLDDPVQNPDVPCTKRLRFAYGYSNAGEGPLHLEFSPARDTAASSGERILTGTVVQRVFRRPSQRDAYDVATALGHPAGPYHLHASHQHFHYDPMYEITLHAYDPVTRERGPVLSRAPKVGNCGHDLFMADFSSTKQDPRGLHDSDGCTGLHGARPDHAVIGLSTGWGDIYPEGVGDSYVPLTGGAPEQDLRDGHYLLVQRVNVGGALLESDYGDDVGYTHFELRGADGPDPSACIYERGLGESPAQRLRAKPLAWPALHRHC